MTKKARSQVLNASTAKPREIVEARRRIAIILERARFSRYALPTTVHKSGSVANQTNDQRAGFSTEKMYWSCPITASVTDNWDGVATKSRVYQKGRISTALRKDKRPAILADDWGGNFMMPNG
jgi:hypothetical protein